MLASDIDNQWAVKRQFLLLSLTSRKVFLHILPRVDARVPTSAHESARQNAYTMSDVHFRSEDIGPEIASSVLDEFPSESREGSPSVYSEGADNPTSALFEYVSALPISDPRPAPAPTSPAWRRRRSHLRRTLTATAQRVSLASRVAAKSTAQGVWLATRVGANVTAQRVSLMARVGAKAAQRTSLVAGVRAKATAQRASLAARQGAHFTARAGAGLVVLLQALVLRVRDVAPPAFAARVAAKVTAQRVSLAARVGAKATAQRASLAARQSAKSTAQAAARIGVAMQAVVGHVHNVAPPAFAAGRRAVRRLRLPPMVVTGAVLALVLMAGTYDGLMDLSVRRAIPRIAAEPAGMALVPMTVLAPLEGLRSAIPQTSRIPPRLSTAASDNARRANDVRAIQAVVHRYRDAVSILDVTAVHALWPTADVVALRKEFARRVEQNVDFEACRIASTGTDATASCAGVIESGFRAGDRRPRVERRRWQFMLRKSGERWQISDVRTDVG
jgi:hypothetical protein